MKLDKMLYASYLIIAIWLWILYRSFSEGHVVNIWTYRVVIILLIINVIKMITDIKIVRISKLIVNTQIMKYIEFDKSLNLPKEWK